MGQLTSKADQNRFEYYRSIIDKAVIDTESYREYRKSREIIIQALQVNESLIEHFVVDYIKYLLKNISINAKMKFNALLFFKDVLKTGNVKLLKYTEKKILTRLYKIALVNPPSACLKPYSLETDNTWSEHIQHLILETLGRLAESEIVNKSQFFKYASKLKLKGILPVLERYWDFPSGNVTEKFSDEYQLAFEWLNALFGLRKDVQNLIIGERENPLDIKINNVVEFYEQQKSKAENDPSTKKILSEPMTTLLEKEREISERLARELFFAEDFIKSYKSLKEGKTKYWFYRNYHNICRMYFDEEEADKKSFYKFSNSNLKKGFDDFENNEKILEESKSQTPNSIKKSFFSNAIKKNENNKFLDCMTIKEIEGDFKKTNIKKIKPVNSKKSMEFGDFSDDSLKRDFKFLVNDNDPVHKMSKQLSTINEEANKDNEFSQEMLNHKAHDKLIKDLKKKNEESVIRLQSKLTSLQKEDCPTDKIFKDTTPYIIGKTASWKKDSDQMSIQNAKSSNEANKQLSIFKEKNMKASTTDKLNTNPYSIRNYKIRKEFEAEDKFLKTIYKDLDRVLTKKRGY